MTTRRDLLGAAAALTGTLALPATTLAKATPGQFVRREGTRLTLRNKPYRFVGANIWYGAYLGANTEYGNRDRLRRELDKLQSIGVTNLRLLASSETSPLKNAVSPSFRSRGTVYNPALLDGLDFCLAEMGKRGMKAVLYLTNFWEWSGGMMTYLSYVNGGKYIDANDPAHPWPQFADATSEFYRTPKAIALYHDWVRALVGRTNAVTGTPYRDDPTIMAWQLANEPRPGGGPQVAARNLPFFQDWVRGTARLIKTLDQNHLVSTGSEGLKGSVERADIYNTEHGFPEIDYCTAHIWPLNWSWVSAKDLPGTHEAGRAKVAEYLQQHEALARGLNKPLVIEEFGYPRDGGGYDPESTTAFKDLYYGQILAAVRDSVRTGGPIAGSNFWAWNGEGRAVHGDHRFRTGDTSWVGDPPHEPQGWYGVYDTDASTHALIKSHAQALAVAAAPTAAR
ncbi:glycoside hydrolase 5 family protein [Sphingomonas sp. S2-65]|uniref:glycoside hydrolase 5 family protein n=1 Tax=Sphingomonas sp. S2-65 TaxID=2903960 RepID=UPI001F38135E|nr:mannanase [Sphingomonas sp. S2-65]UYY59427.1 mannanase [Sphingomonas sp. S2-65]